MKEKICTYFFIVGVYFFYVASKIDEDKALGLLTNFLNSLSLDTKINGVWYTNEDEVPA